MTALNQDFATYQGDTVKPIFTVVDANGNAVDISGASDIAWTARRNPGDAPLLSKSKQGGTIAFVAGGTDGRFQVTILGTDTQPLSGFYVHEATVTDSGGAVTTVTLGRMQVGPVVPSWSYSGDPASSPKDAVRYWIQDTDETDQKFSDAEIAFVLTAYPDPLRAGAQCARTLAAKYAKRVNRRVGDLAISYSDLSKHYYDLADELDRKADLSSTPYAGGTSKSDKRKVAQNTDRAQPPFRERQFDNQTGPQNLSDHDGGESF